MTSQDGRTGMRAGGRENDCSRCGAPYRRVMLGSVPTCGCWSVQLVVDEHGAVRPASS
jgi:predicted  nucleic acid-binding Zn-ribbon protein